MGLSFESDGQVDDLTCLAHHSMVHFKTLIVAGTSLEPMEPSHVTSSLSTGSGGAMSDKMSPKHEIYIASSDDQVSRVFVLYDFFRHDKLDLTNIWL